MRVTNAAAPACGGTRYPVSPSSMVSDAPPTFDRSGDAWGQSAFADEVDAGGGEQYIELIGSQLWVAGIVDLGRFRRVSDFVNIVQGYLVIKDVVVLTRTGEATRLTMPELRVLPDDIVQGPDLTNINLKFAKDRNPQGRSWLYSWIKDPTRYHARTVMPNLFLNPDVHPKKSPADPAKPEAYANSFEIKNLKG